MRIAWTSNAPWCGTGYGGQTSEVVPKLKAAGHDVAIQSNYGLAGSTIDWNGIPVMPQGIDGYSNDLTPFQISQWIGKDGNGLGITLFDVWVYKAPQWDELPLLSWTPVDHGPLPPDEVRAFFDRPGRKWALAMSRSGEKALIDSGIARDRVFYAPHSFNPSVFHPGESTMRAKMLIPDDAHVTMINAANKGNTPIRKCFPEMLLAWATFANRHPDAYLYLHTEVLGMAGGVNIQRLLERFKAPLDRVRLVPQYELRMGIASSVMGDLYRSADVLLSTSRGEGFGLGVLEAQATGIPAIATNWTAQPELVGSGWLVDGELEWDEFQGSFWKVPRTEEILNALESSHALKGDAAASADAKAKAIAHAAPDATDRVFADHWVPLLATMESLVREPAKVISLPVNRAARRAGKK